MIERNFRCILVKQHSRNKQDRTIEHEVLSDLRKYKLVERADYFSSNADCMSEEEKRYNRTFTVFVCWGDKNPAIEKLSKRYMIIKSKKAILYGAFKDLQGTLIYVFPKLSIAKKNCWINNFSFREANFDINSWRKNRKYDRTGWP